MRLHIDLEVFSVVDIRSAPLDVYASDPSTKIILCAYAFDDGPVSIYAPDTDSPPTDLFAGLRHPDVEVIAWNVNYERTVLKYKGLNIPLRRWCDPMAHARYAGLPGRLKDCAKIPMIGVPAEEATKSETALIKRFCLPNKDGNRNLPADYPEDWALFVEYCRKDVQTMRHVQTWLEPRFPFPESEREIWILDQQINERGLPVDVELARHADAQVKRILAYSFRRQAEITQLENPNSIQQLHGWLQNHGYPYDSLGKAFIAQALVSAPLTDEGREVLTLRLQSAKSSVKKFSALVEETGPDGRLRQQFKYAGAHTLRWSGRGVQPQNLTRKETDKDALKALLEGRPVNSMQALSTCIRPCIRAPKGKKLVVADLAAIENRVLAWLSGCEPMLEIYANNLDPYLSFGVELYNKEYDQITKSERQICKPAVLGCGYGLGGGQEREMQNGQKVKTGLWAYAEGMGVNITQTEARKMVSTFRMLYSDVVQYWYHLEDAFFAAVKTRQRQQVGTIYFTATDEAVKIELPSGRFIHYLNPHAWRGSEGLKISFDGFRAQGWGRQSTWGGRLTENVVQAISRDVLAEGMKRASRAGMTVVGHVHDEIILEEIADIHPADPRIWVHDPAFWLEQCMSDPIAWAHGLPLAAEGWEGEFYMKG